MKTSEVLNKAADLIEQRGWVWGGGWNDSYDTGTPLCLEGGIMAAAGFTSVTQFQRECPAYEAVCRHLDMDPEITRMSLTQGPWVWNDKEGRTASEVIEVLRATAVIEAAREDARVAVSA